MSERVVVFLPARDNEFQDLQAEDARRSATTLGLDVEVVHCDNNAIEQIQQIFKVLHGDSKPRAVVVEPVAAQGLERVARRAASDGVGWAVLNSTAGYVAPLRGEFPGCPVFAVGSDQVEIGRLQGDQIHTLLPSGGTVLYVQGPPSSAAAVERLSGAQQRLEGGGVRLVVVDALWSEESARQVTESWLRLKTHESVRIDLVAAQDDAMARGARSATRSDPGLAKRFEGVPFLGIDGVPSVGQEMVKRGELTGTIIMPSNVGPALEAVSRWLKGGELPPETIRVPVTSYPDRADLAAAAKPSP